MKEREEIMNIIRSKNSHAENQRANLNEIKMKATMTLNVGLLNDGRSFTIIKECCNVI